MLINGHTGPTIVTLSVHACRGLITCSTSASSNTIKIQDYSEMFECFCMQRLIEHDGAIPT